jgi:hypothetical protein
MKRPGPILGIISDQYPLILVILILNNLFSTYDSCLIIVGYLGDLEEVITFVCIIKVFIIEIKSFEMPRYQAK